MARWLFSRTAIGILATLWIVLLLGARFSDWTAVQPAATVVIIILGVITVVVILYRWGVTQDAVVDRAVERAQIAEEVDKAIEEDKSARREAGP